MKKASLAEIMGKKGAESSGRKLSMDDLPALVGDALPEMPISPIGRFRLLNTLKNRFGYNYRNIPGVMDIVKDFDSKMELETRASKLREIKYTAKGKA